MNISTLYPSKSKKTNDCANSYPGITLLESLCRDNPFDQTTGRVETIHFLLKNGCVNRQSAKRAFYRCFASPEHNQEVIKALCPYLEKPFRTDFLSKLRKKPVPMKELTSQKFNIAIGPWIDQPDWKMEILMNMDIYRDDNGNFTLTKASQFINKFFFPTLPATLKDPRDISTAPSKPFSFTITSDPWENPLAWTCISPFSESNRLEIAKLFLAKRLVENESRRKALETCLLNQEYNASIIEILENKLVPESSK